MSFSEVDYYGLGSRLVSTCLPLNLKSLRNPWANRPKPSYGSTESAKDYGIESTRSTEAAYQSIFNHQLNEKTSRQQCYHE